MKNIIKSSLLVLTSMYFLTLNVYAESSIKQNSTESTAGNNQETAIVINNFKSVKELHDLAKEYVNKNYPGYSIVGKGYTRDFYILKNEMGNKKLLLIFIENSEDDKKLIYFNITDGYTRLQSMKDKKARMEFEELEKNYSNK